MESSSVQESSPVTPCVGTRGVCTSLLVLLVSPQRVLQLATAPLVAWTAPFHSGSLSSPGRRRCFSELARSRLSFSGHATPSSAPLASPQPLSSSWLWLPSLGKPALSSPSRAYLTGAPPWSPALWLGLCSPPFLLILVPKAPLSRADACPRPLSSGLRPETPAVGRVPPPCRHS